MMPSAGSSRPAVRYRRQQLQRITSAARLVLLLVAIPLSLAPRSARAQVHTPGMVHSAATVPAAPGQVPVQGGQAAFSAIAEIVRLLSADSTTDWARANIERLRQHLLDMDLVTMRSAVSSRNIPGGAAFTVRGTGATVGAIQRMTKAHAAMLAMEQGPRLVRTDTPDGVRVVVTARDTGNASAVARVRALGFIGMLADGDHHQAHHLLMAQGAAMTDHAR